MAHTQEQAAVLLQFLSSKPIVIEEPYAQLLGDLNCALVLQFVITQRRQKHRITPNMLKDALPISSAISCSALNTLQAMGVVLQIDGEIIVNYSHLEQLLIASGANKNDEGDGEQR